VKKYPQPLNWRLVDFAYTRLASKALFTVGQGAESVQNTPFGDFHVEIRAVDFGVLEGTFPQVWEAPPAWGED
jgi:hypothetical protein